MKETGAGSENRTRDIQLGKLNKNVENQSASSKTALNSPLLEQWVTLSRQNQKLVKALRRGDVSILLELHRWFSSGDAVRTLGAAALIPALVNTASMIEDELIRRGLPVSAGSALRGLFGGAQ